jgi:hypothetical protein
MPSFYVDPVNGDAANGGTDPYTDAVDNLTAGFDLVKAAGAGPHVIYVIGNAAQTPTTEPATIKCDITPLQIVSLDASLRTATNSSFDKTQRPIIQFTGGGYTFDLSGSGFTGFYGMIISNSAGSGGLFTTPTAQLYGYETTWTGGSFANVTARSGSSFVRCHFKDMRSGIFLNGSGRVEVEASIFENNSEYHVQKGSGSPTIHLKNCLLYKGCSNGGKTYPIQAFYGDDNLDSSILLDNYSAYGLPGNTFNSVLVYSSDAATYHTTSNYNGTKGSTDYEFDPQLTDPENGNFVPQASNRFDQGPMAGLQGGSDLPTKDFNRDPLWNGLGPLNAANPWEYIDPATANELIGPDFTINAAEEKSKDRDRNVVVVPFGLTTPGPISLHKRNSSYKLTK